MGHKFNAILSFGALAKEEILLKECWQILRKPRGRKKKGQGGGGGVVVWMPFWPPSSCYDISWWCLLMFDVWALR